MNLCNDDHEEVCYAGHSCPACLVIEDAARNIAVLEQKIEALEEKISGLEERL